MPVEKPWKHLYSSIVDILKTKSVLETWEQRQFKKPPQLRQLATCCLFKDQPLLGDLKDEMYLASDYRHKRTKTLEDLGVYTMTWNEVMIRIQADLTSQSSRIKIKKRDSPWYEAFAQLGLLALQGESSGISEWFKRQPLICLSQANQWTSAPNMGYGGLKNIYFPNTGTVPIPENIGLNLVDKTASANAKVRELYIALGVEECPKDSFRQDSRVSLVAKANPGYLSTPQIPIPHS